MYADIVLFSPMHRDIKKRMRSSEAAKEDGEISNSFAQSGERDRDMRNCQDEIDRAVRWAMVGSLNSQGSLFNIVGAYHDMQVGSSIG